MTRDRKLPELDTLPTRNGGEDQLHNHLDYNPSDDVRASCGACAQLANDFAWIGFHDAIAGRESEFANLEELLEQTRWAIRDKAAVA